MLLISLAIVNKIALLEQNTYTHTKHTSAHTHIIRRNRQHITLLIFGEHLIKSYYDRSIDMNTTVLYKKMWLATIVRRVHSGKIRTRIIGSKTRRMTLWDIQRTSFRTRNAQKITQKSNNKNARKISHKKAVTKIYSMSSTS